MATSTPLPGEVPNTLRELQQSWRLRDESKAAALIASSTIQTAFHEFLPVYLDSNNHNNHHPQSKSSSSSSATLSSSSAAAAAATAAPQDQTQNHSSPQSRQLPTWNEVDTYLHDAYLSSERQMKRRTVDRVVELDCADRPCELLSRVALFVLRVSDFVQNTQEGRGFDVWRAGPVPGRGEPIKRGPYPQFDRCVRIMHLLGFLVRMRERGHMRDYYGDGDNDDDDDDDEEEEERGVWDESERDRLGFTTWVWERGDKNKEG